MKTEQILRHEQVRQVRKQLEERIPRKSEAQARVRNSANPGMQLQNSARNSSAGYSPVPPRDRVEWEPQSSNGISSSALSGYLTQLNSSFADWVDDLPSIKPSQATAATSASPQLTQAQQDAATAEFIDNYLGEQGSPAANSNAGALMVQYGRDYGVDPMLLLAIAGHETVYGKEGVGMDGMLGVGAYDNDPNNSTRNPEFSGVETQIRRGAETFAALREKGGASPTDSIEDQLAAANRAGWATDPDWHLGVKRHYDAIMAANPPSPGSLPSAPRGQGNSPGLAALSFGYDQPAINPNTGDTNWTGWGLGWVNRALQSQGYKVPELQAESAGMAYQQTQGSGVLQQGQPQPGTVVFFKEGDLVRVGIVGPDGQTVRATQEADAQGRTVGDMAMPETVLGWFDTASTTSAKASPSGATSPSQPGRPVDGVDPADPASFFITQNTTQWNPDARYINGKNANCGPTSLAMAALAFGMLPPGTDKSRPEELIESVRTMMTGSNDISAPTGTDDVKRGAEALNMNYHDVGNLGGVNEALSNGQMVVAGSTDHFVLIVGRTADGSYIVNDPFYTGEPGVVKSQAEMEQWFIGGVAVGP